MKAGQHLFMGGGSASATLPALPAIGKNTGSIELNYVYEDLSQHKARFHAYGDPYIRKLENSLALPTKVPLNGKST